MVQLTSERGVGQASAKKRLFKAPSDEQMLLRQPDQYIKRSKRVTVKEEQFGAKITVRYHGREETMRTAYIAKDDVQRLKIARGLLEGVERGSPQIVNAVMADMSQRAYVRRLMLQELATECRSLCQLSRPSLLRSIDPHSLQDIDLNKIVCEWSERSKLLYDVLATVIGAEKAAKAGRLMALAGSILLQQRCPQMSAVQNALGLQLDFGGTRDKTIESMSACGASASTVTLHRRKKDIATYHSSLVQDSIVTRKNQVFCNELAKFPNVNLPVYTVSGSNLRFIEWLLELKATVGELQFPDMTNTRSWAIYGDNLDHTVHSFHSTKGHRGQDIHWFVLVGVPDRVMSPQGLDRTRPRCDIGTIPSSDFLPTVSDNTSLAGSFRFHVMETMVKYVPFMEHMKPAVPKFIDHPYVQEMSRKSDHLILDLLDKSENKGDQVIDIVRYVHQFIPHFSIDGSNVIERLVLGGDVLTNERAYQAQLDLMNATNEMDRLLGVIHRPEGLHMCMNFLKYILEIFFSKSSVQDSGTLYNLSILVDCRKLTLDMTTGYNKARNFVNDVLDGHLLAAVCAHFGVKTLEDLEQCPETCKPPENASKMQQLQYLEQVAQDIVDTYVLGAAPLDIAQEMDFLESSQPKADDRGKFKCTFTGCSKEYKTIGWLKRHLKQIHSVTIDIAAPRRKEADEVYDGKWNYASAFLKVALLYRDTVDAYKMGDGDRVFRNIKFLFLHLSPGQHCKYRLWLWRVMAYDQALLSEEESYQYRHNIAVNLVGGVRNCIANDNLVEIHVRRIKEAMRAMGPNITYDAVRKVAKCIDVLSAMADNLCKSRSGKHAAVKSLGDVKAIATCLINTATFVHLPGREHTTYPNFPINVLMNIDLVNLNQWIRLQKVRAKQEMQVVTK